MPRAMHSLPGKGKEMHPAAQNTSLLSPSLLENVSKCREVILGQRSQQMDWLQRVSLRFLNQFQSAFLDLAEASRKNCKISSPLSGFPLSFLISFFQPFRSHWWLTLPSFLPSSHTFTKHTIRHTTHVYKYTHPHIHLLYPHYSYPPPHTHTQLKYT